MCLPVIFEDFRMSLRTVGCLNHAALGRTDCGRNASLSFNMELLSKHALGRSYGSDS